MRLSIAVIAVSLVLASCTGASDERGTKPSPGDGYHDPAGWSAQIPPDWTVLPFETSKGEASAAGVQISNVELPPPVIEPGLPIQASGLALPTDGIALIVATDDDPKNAQVPPADPVSPPLSLDDFTQGSAGGGGPTFSFLWFEVGGDVLLASIKAGAEADQAPLASLVESIRKTD